MRQRSKFRCCQPHPLSARTPLASNSVEHAVAARPTFVTAAVGRKMPCSDVVPIAADQHGAACVAMGGLTSGIMNISGINITKTRIRCDPPCRAQRLWRCRWTRPPPACPGMGEGRINPTPIRRQSVPYVRPDCTCCIFSTILRIVVHDFARQLFDQLLADHAILARS